MAKPKKTWYVTDLEEKPDIVIDIIASIYGIEASQIKSKDRNPEVVKARQPWISMQNVLMRKSRRQLATSRVRL